LTTDLKSSLFVHRDEVQKKPKRAFRKGKSLTGGEMQGNAFTLIFKALENRRINCCVLIGRL
jgi:hypothetical protein